MLVPCAIVAASMFALAPDDDAPLAPYFRAEVERIAPLAGVKSGPEWFERRPELQRQMLEMLGLWPLPPRSELKARITKVVEGPDFVVENQLFQSMPGLYVTGNLYRPKQVTAPLPTVLYVCGHSRVEKDGVIYGNKTHYQHHAAWFAANGYVCLVLDTLQLGELPGVHHGTYSEGRWWWQARGYTPAGVEAWNAVRALDYLETRPEVDPQRMGVTGRSGGGATSWWLGAIDDRLAAVAPVAGITDLADHVVNSEPTGHYKHGVIEGHCDCMYLCNTYRWDYDAVAALVAPKPLLIENTDADSIFPIAGVNRIHDQVAKVYDWYGVPGRLSLVVGKGGHQDSVELRHAAFAFFEKVLKGHEVAVSEIQEPDRTVPIELLKVLEPGEVPSDCRNATIDETFVPARTELSNPKDRAAWEDQRASFMKALRAKSFAAWPADEPTDAIGLKLGETRKLTRDGFVFTVTEVDSQPGVRLRVWTLALADSNTKQLTLRVPSDVNWQSEIAFLEAFEDPAHDLAKDETAQELKQMLDSAARAWVDTRGFGATKVAPDAMKHVRRRFWLLGQTFDGMRLWDLRCAVRVLEKVRPTQHDQLAVSGSEDGGISAMLLGALESSVDGFVLTNPPSDLNKAPAFLNLERVLLAPEALGLVAPRSVWLLTNHPGNWEWNTHLGKVLKLDAWPLIRPLSP